MLSKGNSDPALCVLNMISTVKGECPMARAKGIDSGLIDQPITRVEGQYLTNVENLIEKYEPRVDLDDVDVEGFLDNIGHYQFDIGLNRLEG